MFSSAFIVLVKIAGILIFLINFIVFASIYNMFLSGRPCYMISASIFTMGSFSLALYLITIGIFISTVVLKIQDPFGMFFLGL